MPSFHRQSLHPTVLQSKTPKQQEDRGVTFLPQPVTSISRPLTVDESWALYFFEKHAQVCEDCRDSYEVYRRGRHLCFKGHTLAQAVAAHVYDGADGHIYSTVKDGVQLVRVEIPKGFDQVRSLIRALERSARHRSREPVVAKEHTHRVYSRQYDRSRNVKVEQPVKPSRSNRHSIHYPEIVDWPSQSPRRAADVENASPRSGQGSLYASDMADRRRSYHTYNVEVREPHRKRENRRSGFWG